MRTEPDGLTRIGGGKYTTYRVMARDVVDAAVDVTHDPRTSRPPASGHGTPADRRGGAA